ncbi:MAG: nitroreductase family protein [Sedimentisphaerales bacterium]|nr:nitroreductase family protein [Sedimentisphaerales bacterium]
MKRLTILVIIIACFTTLGLGQRSRSRAPKKIIQLTKPVQTGAMSFEEALAKRRSVRSLANKPLETEQISQLAWAGQGITDKQRGLRTAPSAGETYPIELYFATEEGLFVYRPAEHSMEQTSDKDIRSNLATAASMQEFVSMAGCDIIVAGSVRKLSNQFRNQARTFMLLEAGHVAQNILLQATCMGLGSVPVGGFTSSKEVSRACRLPAGYEAVYIICVGHTAEQAALEATTNQAGAEAKRVALIVASQNYRDEELFETKMALDAAGIQSVIASTRIGIIRGTLGGIAEANILIGQLSINEYDAIIFIGGIGAVEYVNNPAALNLAREAVRNRKILAAIGTAPTILANASILTGVRVTSLLSERPVLVLAGAFYTGTPVEEDKLIITGRDPGAAMQFGRNIANSLVGR